MVEQAYGESGDIRPLTCENTDEAARCVNTKRPLTRPFGYTKGGLR